jgi:two-component system, response regulator YesN
MKKISQGVSVLYDVVLIDDESIIVEGLKKVIRWEDHDCRVITCAQDAYTGAQIIRKYKPQIVFTDVRMPNMDGLTMIAGLKSEFPHMQITVLTGYRDFEYAQKAISLGVTRLLLKPSKMDEINEALHAMTENLKHLSTSTATEEVSEEVANSGSLVVSNALRYMEEHYTQKLTLITVAEKIYVSQWHLSKLLNKYTQQSFNDLLNKLRIKKAKELLCDPGLKTWEISEQLGFNDVTHFFKTFKKFEQCTPNEYRHGAIHKL